MNILVVSNYQLYQDPPSSFVHQLSDACARLGHRVRVVILTALGKTDCFGRKVNYSCRVDKWDAVELVHVSYLSLSNLGDGGFNKKSAVRSVLWNRNQVLGDFRPDIIHAHSLTTSTAVGIALKEKLGIPLVVTTHGSDTARVMARGEGHLLKAMCDRADYLTAVSNPLRDLLKSCGTPTPITTIHNGFVPRIPETEEKDPYSIIQVGHLIKSKHFDSTIRAFAALKPQYPQLKLTLVGKGVLRQELEDLCKELGVSDSVEFTGQIPNSEVFSRMCRANYFVMASKPEGFGIVYLEAMAAGCLTIGTRDQGIADILAHNHNGCLVEAGDHEAIAEILASSLEHPDKAREIARNGQALARTMTWEKAAKGYLSLFETL